MLRYLLLVAIAAAATTALSLATPGQTPAQLLAWGKSNVAFHGFKPTMDEETGDTDFMATLRVDGLSAEFHSEPSEGIARREYIAFDTINDLTKHRALMVDTVRTVYGAQYAADFQAAARVPLRGRALAWRGAKLAYAAFGSALFVISNAEFPIVLKNLRACDAVDCEE